MRRAQTRFGLLALRKRNLLLHGIDVWGLAGVMVVLLCIFMTVPTPTPYHRMAVDWAVAPHSTSMPGATKEDAMQIIITRDGGIYFPNSRVVAESLPDEIRERVQNGAERKIYLLVDARARYRDAEKVLDQIRLAGIREVSFLTDQPYPHR